MGRAAKIYAEQLSFFEHGHPLWYPEPTRSLDGECREVHIGDVGYIDDDGAFRRLFNVTFDTDHDLNSGGVPDGFKPLHFDQRWNDIKTGFLNPGPMCSRSVKSRRIEGHVSGGLPATAGLGVSYRFECSSQEGAMLVLTDYATKSSLGLDGPFEQYMLRNHQSWCNFAANLGVRREPQDLILVRGTIKTTSWAVAAVFDAGHHVHEVTFDGRFGDIASAGAKYSRELGTVCSFEQRVGPYTPGQAHTPLVEPATRLAEQCVFLSYFKVKYRKFLANKIVANADVTGASTDEDDPSDIEIELNTPRLTPRCPIDDVLDHILEHSHADMAIASHANIAEYAIDHDLYPNVPAFLRQHMPIIVIDEHVISTPENKQSFTVGRIPGQTPQRGRHVPPIPEATSEDTRRGTLDVHAPYKQLFKLGSNVEADERPEPRGACINCRKSKAKCTFERGKPQCNRCRTRQVKCSGRKSKEPISEMSESEMKSVLAQIQFQDDLIDKLRAHLSRCERNIKVGLAAHNTLNPSLTFPSSLDQYSDVPKVKMRSRPRTSAPGKLDSSAERVSPAKRVTQSPYGDSTTKNKSTSSIYTHDNIEYPWNVRALELPYSGPRIPDFLRTRLVSQLDVERLFNIFWNCINVSTSLLDPALYSMSNLYWRSPFLFTAICCISSRFYAERPELYLRMVPFAKHAAVSALVEDQNIDSVYAFILLSLYPNPSSQREDDKSWVYIGIAIRIAMDLELNGSSMTSPSETNEMHVRELLNRTRAWLHCFNLDRLMSMQYGKPPAISSIDYLVNHSAQWWSSSPYNMSFDIQICASTAALALVGKVKEGLYRKSDGLTKLEEPGLTSLAFQADDELCDLWFHWRGLLLKHTDISDIRNEFRIGLARFVFSYARTSILSFRLTRVSPSVRDIDNCWRFRRAALDVVNTILEDLDIFTQSILLRYGPESQTVFVTSTCVSLLKSLQPPYSSEMQRLEIRSKVEKIAEVLDAPQVVIDDYHSPKLSASLLKQLLLGGTLASEQEDIKPTKSTRLTRSASTLRNSAVPKSEPEP